MEKVNGFYTTAMAKPVKERNHLVDVLKCLACFSVVMLHYPTKEFISEIYIIQVMIGRCGVPLFLMISGWFAGKKMNAKTKNGKKGEIWFLKQSANMIKYFLIFSVIAYVFYLAYDVLMQRTSPSINIVFSSENIKKLLLWNQPFYSGMLWYLPAYAYCLIVYWIASFFDKGYKIISVISPALMILYYVLGRYSVLFFGEALPHYYASNFIFAAIPMFTIGFNLVNMKIKFLTRENTIILLILSLFLLFAECSAFSLKPEISSQRNNYIFNLVVSFLIMYYVSYNSKIKVSENNFMAVIGKKYSLYIYVFQGMANSLLLLIIKYLKPYTIGILITELYRTGKPFAVFFTSFALALVYTLIVNLIKKPFRNRKLNHKEQSEKVAVLS